MKLTRASVVVELQELIKEWVFPRKLCAGDRINEKAMAEVLGISRGPIREALQALRQEGIVEIIPNRGAFLRTLTLKEVLDLTMSTPARPSCTSTPPVPRAGARCRPKPSNWPSWP